MRTSAKEEEGRAELIERIKDQIPWDEMSATVTPLTFKRVKDYVLALKEDERREGVLVDPETLRGRLEATDADWQFSDADMMTAVRHLQTHGYVTILQTTSGEQSILLAPDLLVNLASSFVLEARRNPRGLGVLEEERLLAGKYGFAELADLAADEQKTLTDAAAVLFVEHNLCFRETLGQQTFLVFPSLINEKRPKLDEAATADDVSYTVRGSVENVYATLVVLLGYTNTFHRTHQWQNQAQYEVDPGQVCGFRQSAEHEGEIELVLYYGIDTPEEICRLFQGMFERFLKRRDVEISRYPSIDCPKCKSRLERAVVTKRIDEGLGSLFCSNCGKKMKLPGADEILPLPPSQRESVEQQHAVAGRRTKYEAAVVRVKSLLLERTRGEKRPSCFISYAWGVTEHERWVEQLARDLQNAGVEVIFDRWHNPPGARIDRYIERIVACDFVVVVGTPRLREKYQTQDADPVVASELQLINDILMNRNAEGDRVIPVLLDGTARESFPPMLVGTVHVDFCTEERYFVRLFELVLTVHGIPPDHPGLVGLL